MATFEAQVEGLTSLSIDGSSAPTQTELTQFLTDGASEVINAMPRSLKLFCATEDTFTSTAVGSEAETLESSSLLAVTRSDGTIEQPCRKIPASLRGRASDSADMNAATTTDPVYYIYNGKVNALPASGSCKYLEVNNPAVAYGDSAISSFPDEYEYLVPLYASVKSLQNAMASKAGNSDITTALTAINTEIDETLTIADSAATEIGLANAEVDKATVEVTLANAEVDKMAAEVGLSNAELDEALVLVDAGIDTATAAINTAVDKVSAAVVLSNTQFDSAVTANTAEDIELAASHVNAGNGFLSEAQGSVGEAQGYVAEVSARVNQVSSQVGVAQGFLGTAGGYGGIAQGFLGVASGYANAAQGFIATANAYLSQIQSKLGIAQGYSSEVQVRLSVITTEYTWQEKQQAKLQVDYDKGVQLLAKG